LHSSRQAGKAKTESAVLFFPKHFPRDSGHLYVDVAPSATCLLVKERAQESTVRAQGCTAQGNQPERSESITTVGVVDVLFLCGVRVVRACRSRSDAASVPVNFRERSLKQEHQ